MKNTAREELAASLEAQAIRAASSGAWSQAVLLNQEILKLKSENIGALSRLARALGEEGKILQAQKTYQKVLKLDPFNNIATKNLKRLADQKNSSSVKKNSKKPVRTGLFLEESGKTKIVKLVRLASAETLSDLDGGDQVKLLPKNRTISISDLDNTYLGTIPEDISFRLIRLIKGGNQYQAFVKHVDRQSLEIFIRETKRAKKFKDYPSFTTS